MTEPDAIRIIRVELKPESYKTYRATHDTTFRPIDGRGREQYSVMLVLSRPLSVYALRELGRNSPFYIDFDNPQEVELSTDLETVRREFVDLEAAIMTADSRGRQAQQDAEAEDARLRALRDEINKQIEQSN